MDNNTQQTKKSRIKNFLIYILFNFIYGCLLPIGVIVLDVVWVNAQGNETITTLQAIVFLIEAAILFTINEFLVCKTAKKAADSSYLLSKFAFIFNCITILFTTYLLFGTLDFFNIKFVITYWFWICFAMIILKMASYILAKKLALKEKLQHKKIIFTVFAIYLLLIFMMFHLVVPSGINKFLFNMFGTTDFSSKELHVYITDNYIEKCGNISYFHKLDEKELQCFEDDLTLNTNFTTSDISKLSKLRVLEINNITFDEFVDFTNNKELVSLTINNSKINSLDSKLLASINRVKLNNVEINTFIIESGNLEEIYVEKGKIDNFKISGNTIKRVETDETPIKSLEIKDTTKLEVLRIEKSTIETALLDNNINLENRDLSYDGYIIVEIEKINDLTIKNTKNIESLIKNSAFTFKNIRFLENKEFHLENNSYLKLDGSTLYVPEGTKVKELILKNMTAIVKDYYHELISCDDKGTCSYDAEEKIKVQGAESILGDHIELYDNNIKLFEWLVLDYEAGEI